MKVLVTGAAGFLGSHACSHFRELGWEVVGLDNLTGYELERSGYSSKPRDYMLASLKSLEVKFIKGDIKSSLAPFEVDYIIHTAAQPSMTLSIENPRLDFEGNTLGTFNVLELARRQSIPIAICSTIHVYGNRLNQSLMEDKTRLRANPETIGEDYPVMNGEITPLHASKRAGELYGLCYIDTYNLKAGIFRLSGMYGPRQFAGIHHGWVSHFIISTLLNRSITIYDTAKQVRDILYAIDAAKLFESFYKHQRAGLYTVGGGIENSVSLLETLTLIEEISGIKPQIKMAGKRLGDLHYFVAENKKAKEKLCWNPEVKPREGLEKTIQWTKENINLFQRSYSPVAGD